MRGKVWVREGVRVRAGEGEQREGWGAVRRVYACAVASGGRGGWCKNWMDLRYGSYDVVYGNGA